MGRDQALPRSRDPIAAHFRPIQPRTDVDVTPTDGAVVHGALITALASSDVTNVNPVLSRPTIDLAASRPRPARLSGACSFSGSTSQRRR